MLSESNSTTMSSPFGNPISHSIGRSTTELKNNFIKMKRNIMNVIYYVSNNERRMSNSINGLNGSQRVAFDHHS